MTRQRAGAAKRGRAAPAVSKIKAEEAPASAGGKSIVLFSDGTGNSSAQLFKTNVWRMYEAVALGPAPEDKRPQISFYDDGVGTSGFKPLAALGGAFGWGLKRNVLDLYRYACRNYTEGDHIYGFGFSRGAFTMRLVIALIADQGLVSSTDETELEYRSRCAYRAFRESFLPRKLKWPTVLLRSLRNKWRARRERRKDIKPYNRKDNLDPVIRFVGVWDTVSAYGGPIAEMTRAVDNWIYPLSMPDYELNAKVECARHALALDDERDAFQPLLWDELVEEARAKDALDDQLAALKAARKARTRNDAAGFSRNMKKAAGAGARKRRFRNRIQQVWFTGMHSDVGGGYPDESLSYVSLLWMMEEAEKAGLRTLDTIKNRYFALANSYGPMHNSRGGLGAYYRYQPRKIAAWVHPLDDEFLMMRDPDIEDKKGREHGLLRRVLVHESVIARIHTGTVRYAPITLPQQFEAIPPQKEGENIDQADSEDDGPEQAVTPPSKPLIAPAILKNLNTSMQYRFDCQENLWDLVWRRRIAYFATLTVTLLLVALPWWNPFPWFEDPCSDARCVLPSLIRSTNVLVPGFAEVWIEAIALAPVTGLILGIAIYALMRWGRSIERQLADRSYLLWRDALDGTDLSAAACVRTRVRRFRENIIYQRLFRGAKWYVLPGVFGALMLAVILYVPLVLVTQASLAYSESSHHFCAPEKRKDLRWVERADLIYYTNSPCLTPGLFVRKNQVYDIVFQLPVQANGEPAPWWDDRTPSRPGSLTRIRASGFWQMLGMPMRRVIEASYLQPLAQVTRMKETPRRRWFTPPEWLRQRLPDLDKVHVTPLELEVDEDFPDLYRARFKAPETGSLQLYSNDAQLPFGSGRAFYANNCGVARVTVTRIVPRQKGKPRQQLIEEPGDVIILPKCAVERAAEAAADD